MVAMVETVPPPLLFEQEAKSLGPCAPPAAVPAAAAAEQAWTPLDNREVAEVPVGGGCRGLVGLPKCRATAVAAGTEPLEAQTAGPPTRLGDGGLMAIPGAMVGRVRDRCWRLHWYEVGRDGVGVIC